MKYNLRAPIIFLIGLFMFLTIFSKASAVLAQGADPSPTPTQAELQLQEQKRLLELQRDIELAKKAIRDAQPQTPTPTATPLAGDTTLDEGVRMETDIVTYKAMAEAAKILVYDIGVRLKDVNGPKPITNLAIYDAQVVKDWRFYQAVFPAFKGQAEDILTSYTNLVCASSSVDPIFYNKYCVHPPGALFVSVQSVTEASFSPAAIQSAFAVGGNVIKSFIDLAALFRTDTKITGKSVTVDESALVAEVFRVLKYKRPNTNLYYPEVFPPRVDPNGQSETLKLVGLLFIFKAEADRLIKSEKAEQEALAASIKAQVAEKAQLDPELSQVKLLKQQLGNLHTALGAERVRLFRQKLWQEIVEVEGSLSKLRTQAFLEARIATLKGQINPVLANIDAKDATIKPLVELNARFQKFVDEFIKVDANGTNALALFIRSEDIEAALPDVDSYWLEIKSVAAGGNNRIRKNLIWFFAGARVDHSGGVIIEYTLYNKQGAVVVSDKLSHYEGYVAPKKIRNGSFKDPDLD